MNQPGSTDVTHYLERIHRGDQVAKKQLFTIAYEELRDLAASLMYRERAEHTLQPSVLINEAAIRLLEADALQQISNRRYFHGAMARAMCQILTDHARQRMAVRAGGAVGEIPLDEAVDIVQRETGIDLISLDDALSQLEFTQERCRKVVILRFFGGFSLEEIAEQLDVSLATHRIRSEPVP